MDEEQIAAVLSDGKWTVSGAPICAPGLVGRSRAAGWVHLAGLFVRYALTSSKYLCHFLYLVLLGWCYHTIWRWLAVLPGFPDPDTIAYMAGMLTDGDSDDIAEGLTELLDECV